MQIFHYLDKIKLSNPIFILGSFETIHKGHLELFKKAREFKKDNDIVMVIFKDPTKLPNKTKEVFETLDIRLQKIANQNIDYVILMDYDIKLKLLDGQLFLKSFLQYKPTAFVVGKDYRYGNKAKYGSEDIGKIFKNVFIIKHKLINDTKISTSIIKEQIPFGEIALTNSLLSED
jgi:riboflavin kinase/FMN adenylyltransferase